MIDLTKKELSKISAAGECKPYVPNPYDCFLVGGLGAMTGGLAGARTGNIYMVAGGAIGGASIATFSCIMNQAYNLKKG